MSAFNSGKQNLSDTFDTTQKSRTYNTHSNLKSLDNKTITLTTTFLQSAKKQCKANQKLLVKPNNCRIFAT